jgi:acetyltransferase-like isoleucine patch superfamily enzyme
MLRMTYKLRGFIVNTLLASVIVPVDVRVRALRALGMRIGAGSRVHPLCHLANTDITKLANITIGDHTYINSKCFFESLDTITIGARVSLAMDVMLCTTTHSIGSSDRRAGPSRPAPIVIEDGCWLGVRSLILPGVTIGRGCVIAAGAVVTADCEPNGLYAGVPARRVRTLV